MLALPDADATQVVRQKIDGTISLASDQVIDRIALAQPGAIAKAVEDWVFSASAVLAMVRSPL